MGTSPRNQNRKFCVQNIIPCSVSYTHLDVYKRQVWQGVQAVQLVGCGVIGEALAVLLVSVCFWLAVRVGWVICCGGGVLVLALIHI